MNNLVLFDKATYDKLLKEVPSYKLITPSVVSERLKITGSLARRALDELQNKGIFIFLLKVKFPKKYLAVMLMYYRKLFVSEYLQDIFFAITKARVLTQIQIVCHLGRKDATLDLPNLL